MAKCLLDLSAADCRTELLKSRAYSNIELPNYFEFDLLLQTADNNLVAGTLSEKQLTQAKASDAANHSIYNNKDGRYAWRRFELINPFLYISLVHLITEPSNWAEITSRMVDLTKDPRIVCHSVPVLSSGRRSQKAAQIKTWLEQVESTSICMALDYELMFQTDITDCYGALYTHSVSWALHGRAAAKTKRKYSQLLGNKVDCHLQAMRNGQTNGIPQGSTLMDLIAEIVLAYADSLLLERLNNQKFTADFRVIRYRDDYRVFVHSAIDGEVVMKALTETLIDLGMRLSTAKTRSEAEFILAAIKSDKVALIDRTESHSVTAWSYRKELLSILQFGHSHPNSGSIKSRLSRLYERLNIRRLLRSWRFSELGSEHISVLTQIAVQSPSAFLQVAAHMSVVMTSQKDPDKTILFDKVISKIRVLPNAGLLEVGLQRIMLPNGINRSLDEPLTSWAVGNGKELFDIGWVGMTGPQEVAFRAISCINGKTLAKAKKRTIVPLKEIKVFAGTPITRIAQTIVSPETSVTLAAG